jgi:hypothetical protein
MPYRVIFIVSYVLLNLSPLFVVTAIILGSMGIEGWVLVLPFFLIQAPAGAYIASYRCFCCGNVVYTVAHLKQVPGGLKHFPIYYFHNCPSCHKKL